MTKCISVIDLNMSCKYVCCRSPHAGGGVRKCRRFPYDTKKLFIQPLLFKILYTQYIHITAIQEKRGVRQVRAAQAAIPRHITGRHSSPHHWPPFLAKSLASIPRHITGLHSSPHHWPPFLATSLASIPRHITSLHSSPHHWPPFLATSLATIRF